MYNMNQPYMSNWDYPTQYDPYPQHNDYNFQNNFNSSQSSWGFNSPESNFQSSCSSFQRFNIDKDTKSVSTPLAPHFKLNATMSPKTVEEREYMTRAPYASAVGSLIYTMVSTRPDLSQAVFMVSRYMHDPG